MLRGSMAAVTSNLPPAVRRLLFQPLSSIVQILQLTVRTIFEHMLRSITPTILLSLIKTTRTPTSIIHEILRSYIRVTHKLLANLPRYNYSGNRERLHHRSHKDRYDFNSPRFTGFNRRILRVDFKNSADRSNRGYHIRYPGWRNEVRRGHDFPLKSGRPIERRQTTIIQTRRGRNGYENRGTNRLNKTRFRTPLRWRVVVDEKGMG